MLQKDIDDQYYSTTPSHLHIQDVLVTKQRLELALRSYMNKMKVNWSIALYGSSVNGLYTKERSDIDMSLIFENDIYRDNRIELRNIQRHLEQKFKNSYVGIKFLPIKRLYLLRLTDKWTNLQIDLSINNVLGPFNSQLLATYCKIDSRFMKLCNYLKYLNKLNFKSELNRLTSYSF